MAAYGLLALLAAVPPAAALDLLPTETRLGDHEARVLVRLPSGGRLHVDADGLPAAVVAPGEAPEALAPTPAAFDVHAAPPDASWHGLSGTVEVVVQRQDASHAALIRLRDEAGGGTEIEWPAASRRVPALPVWALVAALALALGAGVSGRGGRRPR